MDANPGLTPATEIATIESYLEALGYPHARIDEPATAGVSWYDDPGIKPSDVAAYDVIIYDTKGWRWHSAESRDTLIDAIGNGKRVFMLGDDTAWGIPGLEPLTHLTGSGYDKNGDAYPASTTVTPLPNTFLTNGVMTAPGPFTYRYDVDVAVATNQGETILATVRDGAPAILSYETLTGGRAIVSLVGVSAAEGTVSDDAGLTQLGHFFDAAMSYLAAPVECKQVCPPGAPLVGVDGGTCVAACPAGTFEEDGRCVEACSAFSVGNQCVDECPTGTLVDGTACVDACPAFVDDGTCVAQCPAFRRGRFCVDSCALYHWGRLCVAQCPALINGRACVAQCPAGKVISGNRCVARCPAGMAPDADGVCKDKIATSTVVNTRSNQALIVGRTTQYRAVVRDVDGALVRTGSVTITIDGTQIGVFNVTNGFVDFSHVYEATGQHVLRANYTGAGYRASSFRDVFRVRNPPPPVDQATSLTLTVSSASLVAYQTASYTATVTTAAGAPVTTGSVTFTFPGPNGPVPFTVELTANGTITLPAQLRAGSHVITASYNPAAGYLASSGSVAVTIMKADTVSVSWSDPNPGPVGVFSHFYNETTAAPPSNYPGPLPLSWETDFACFVNGVQFHCPNGFSTVPGTYVVRIDFLGNADFNPSTSSHTYIRLGE